MKITHYSIRTSDNSLFRTELAHLADLLTQCHLFEQIVCKLFRLSFRRTAAYKHHSGKNEVYSSHID